MDLWKLTDHYGRAFYFEDIKIVKRRLKQLTWEGERDKKNYSWINHNQPTCKQAISDNWVDVEVVSEKEMKDYIFKREVKEDKYRQRYQEQVERFKAEHGLTKP